MTARHRQIVGLASYRAAVAETVRETFHQETLDALFDDARERSLFATTFVVVDLETTGGAPDGGGITEIGAVKVRGGEQLGVFATLVNPREPIPPFITVLTGITQAMLLPAPPIEEVLPSFLEFVADAVLVAHNAPYDVGFLKAACASHGYPWPNPLVLDTAQLARRVLIRDEVPNRKLGTLARCFRTARQPTHRALDDARATVDVLHALIGRLGGHRVYTLGDAMEFVRAVSPDPAPQAAPGRRAAQAPPGCTSSAAAGDRPLYVGTSSGDIATRVRSYFTAAEKRARIIGDAGRRRAGRGDRVRAHARGRGARAAADRRARAAVQPAVEVSGAGGLAQADRRGLPAAVGGPPARQRRRRLPRSVLVPAAR